MGLRSRSCLGRGRSGKREVRRSVRRRSASGVGVRSQRVAKGTGPVRSLTGSRFGNELMSVGTGAEWGEWKEGEQRRLVIGPRGGETRMEEVVLNELEERRQAFWLEQVRGDLPTGLGA